MPSFLAFARFLRLFRLYTRSGISMLCRSAAFWGVPCRYSRGKGYIGARAPCTLTACTANRNLASGILSPAKRGESIIAQGKPRSGAALGMVKKKKLSPERRSEATQRRPTDNGACEGVASEDAKPQGPASHGVASERSETRSRERSDAPSRDGRVSFCC